MDHHWEYVLQAMEDYREALGDPEAQLFAPWSLGTAKLAYLAKAASCCQQNEEAALCYPGTTTRRMPWEVLQIWMASNEQGCSFWVNTLPQKEDK